MRTMQAETAHAKGQGVMCCSIAAPPVAAAAEGAGQHERGTAGEDAWWCVSGAQDAALCVWGARDGALLQRLRLRHWVMAAEAAVGPAGEGHLILSGAFDGACTLWRADALPANPALPGRFARLRAFASPGPDSDPDEEGVLAVSLCLSRRIAACGTNDGSISVWPLDGSDDSPLVAKRGAHKKGVCALCWRGEGGSGGGGGGGGGGGVGGGGGGVEGELLAASEDGACKRWLLEGASSGGGGGAVGAATVGGAGASLRCLQTLEVPTGCEVMGLAVVESGDEVCCALEDGSLLQLRS